MSTNASEPIQNTQQNQRRKPKQARALAKYHAVLDACTQVLGTHGYHKTTVLELSLESGVAVPTLYQYFDSKDAILLAWMDRTIEQMLLNVRRISAAQMGSPSLGQLIETLLQGAMLAFQGFQPGIASLLQGLPQTLSSQLLQSLEDKTLLMLKELFPRECDQLAAEQEGLKLRLMIRMMCGYMLFSVMAGRPTTAPQAEADELSRWIKYYLQEHGLLL